MKYYIVQNDEQRPTTNFDIIKVKEMEENKFLEGLKEDTKVIVEADSLMEAIIKFQNAIAND